MNSLDDDGDENEMKLVICHDTLDTVISMDHDISTRDTNTRTALTL